MFAGFRSCLELTPYVRFILDKKMPMFSCIEFSLCSLCCDICWFAVGIVVGPESPSDETEAGSELPELPEGLKLDYTTPAPTAPQPAEVGQLFIMR